MARMGKKEKRLWVFFLNDKNRIQYNDQCKKCVHDCKQSFRCRIVWCGKYYSKRRKGRTRETKDQESGSKFIKVYGKSR